MSKKKIKNITAEDEFEVANKLVREKLNKELEIAKAAIERAKLLADAVGVPFAVEVGGPFNLLKYVPYTFYDNFSSLDPAKTGVSKKYPSTGFSITTSFNEVLGDDPYDSEEYNPWTCSEEDGGWNGSW